MLIGERPANGFWLMYNAIGKRMKKAHDELGVLE